MNRPSWCDHLLPEPGELPTTPYPPEYIERQCRDQIEAARFYGVRIDQDGYVVASENQPFQPDGYGIIVIPELVDDFKSGADLRPNEIHLWHGTTADNWESIQKNGLKMDQDTLWEGYHGFHLRSDGTLHFTAGHPVFFVLARQSAIWDRNGTTPQGLLLKVRIPDASKLWADEDVYLHRIIRLRAEEFAQSNHPRLRQYASEIRAALQKWSDDLDPSSPVGCRN